MNLPLTDAEDPRHFVLAIAHDLREPLRTICSYAELLKRERGRLCDNDMDRFLTFICDATQGMQDLLGEMLEFALADAPADTQSEADAEAALEVALALLKPAIENTKALVTLDPLPYVTANPQALTRVFQNLISNAVKYHGGARPAIHIAYKLGDADCIFSVADNGIGIEPKYREEIFLPLKRLHSQREYPGTGMGLAICRGIIESQGGRIWLKSAPGSGSTFYFTVPKVKQDHSVSCNKEISDGRFRRIS